MGSTRLPNKVMKKILDKPMLFYMIDRIKHSKYINQIVVATSTLSSDDIIEEFCNKNKINIYRGSEIDVLDRFYQSSLLYQADIIVRFTGDCPLIDPKIVDHVIDKHVLTKADYTSNTLVRSFPRGLDVEVFNFSTLASANKHSLKRYEREHVTPYIYENPDRFKLSGITAEGELFRPDIRITVDTIEDFQFITTLFNLLYDKKDIIETIDIITLLNEKPELLNINSQIKQKKYNGE